MSLGHGWIDLRDMLSASNLTYPLYPCVEAALRIRRHPAAGNGNPAAGQCRRRAVKVDVPLPVAVAARTTTLELQPERSSDQSEVNDTKRSLPNMRCEWFLDKYWLRLTHIPDDQGIKYCIMVLKRYRSSFHCLGLIHYGTGISQSCFENCSDDQYCYSQSCNQPTSMHRFAAHEHVQNYFATNIWSVWMMYQWSMILR